MFSLAKFDAARRAIAEAHRVDEVKAIRDKAEALRLYFKQQGESLVMQNQAAEIKLRAERKAGTLLAEMDKAVGGGNGSNQYVKSNRSHDVTGSTSTLADIGITKIQSYRFQRVARIPERLFEQYVEETVRAGGELTTKGLLELYPVMQYPPLHRAPAAASLENLPHYLEIKQGDTLTVLKTFPNESIDTVLTSPPYYGLRDYGIAGQIGLEPTLDEYLENMLAITAELKRVLKKTGTMWWNHGDSYGTGSGAGSRNGSKEATNRGSHFYEDTGKKAIPGYEKSLLLQAHRLAIRMIDEQGWLLRNIVIWHKPNVMPSSADDRFTVDFEPIFFFTKSKEYFFEPQYEPHQEVSLKRAAYGWHRGKEYPPEANVPEGVEKMGERFVNPRGRNKRCVWTIPTQPFADAHFAVYPEALVETPIKAGCPEFICRKCGKVREKLIQDIGERTWNDTRHDNTLSMGTRGLSFGRSSQIALLGYTDCGCNAPFVPGVVLDPFFGAGTTAIVAHHLNRSWIGIELSEEYIRIARKRLVEHGIYPAQSQSEKAS
jgi:site-specific DNA-methyltransferase (adenine-specific)